MKSSKKFLGSIRASLVEVQEGTSGRGSPEGGRSPLVEARRAYISDKVTNMTKTKQVRIEEKLHKALKMVSVERGLVMSNLVSMICKQHLETTRNEMHDSRPFVRNKTKI